MVGHIISLKVTPMHIPFSMAFLHGKAETALQSYGKCMGEQRKTSLFVCYIVLTRRRGRSRRR